MQFIRSVLSLLLSVGGLLIALPVLSGETEKHLLLQQLEQIASLQVDFSQTLFSRDDETLQSNNGKFVVVDDGRFYWETYEPYPQQVVSDGTTLWIYDPDLEQLTVRQVEASGHDSPIMLFGAGRSDFLDQFEISLAAAGDEKTAENDSMPMTFVLRPKDAGASGVFNEITIYFEKTLPVKLLISDSLLQKTSLQFSDIRLNNDIDASLFSFVAPEGVDVLYEGDF